MIFMREVHDDSLNEIYVCLISRKVRMRKAKDFKFISLVTSVYKITAKVLVD